MKCLRFFGDYATLKTNYQGNDSHGVTAHFNRKRGHLEVSLTYSNINVSDWLEDWWWYNNNDYYFDRFFQGFSQFLNSTLQSIWVEITMSRFVETQTQRCWFSFVMFLKQPEMYLSILYSLIISQQNVLFFLFHSKHYLNSLIHCEWFINLTFGIFSVTFLYSNSQSKFSQSEAVKSDFGEKYSWQ